MLFYESISEEQCKNDECSRTSDYDLVNSEIENNTLIQTLIISVINLVKYYGWLTVPLFLFFCQLVYTNFSRIEILKNGPL